MKKALVLLALSTATFAEVDINEKIGQMILVGFRGDSISSSSQIVKDIKDHKIGSVILFDYDVKLRSRKRNITSVEQVKKLNSDLQSYSKVPLLITVDQEGGLVQRLKKRHGFTKVLSPQEVGSKNSKEFTYRESKKLAKDLKNVGINLNFSPSADVNTNPSNPVIGKIKRSYSSDPKEVSMHIREFIKSHHDEGVATTIKHFPGHGSSKNDSHKGFVDVTETWHEKELIPFSDMINEKKVDILMSAHIFNGGLDPHYPGTLSHNVITKLLREELDYQGVVISDDMNMSAITEHYGFKRAIELAINAGIDILLYGNNIIYEKDIAKKVTKVINELLKEGKIQEDQITDSYNRIMNLKYKMGLIKKFTSIELSKKKRSVASKKSILEKKQFDKNKEIFKKIKMMDN
jgi:beta-N-acetylhexosaminidase